MNTTSGVKRIKLGYTWCYLLQCTGGYLLIDTSYQKYFTKFKKKITKLGIHLSQIRYLLLTHHHDDHTGFAAELVKESGCRVIAHQHSLAPLSQGISEDTMQPVNRRVRFVFSIFELFHSQFTFPPLILGENDIILTGDDAHLLNSIGIDGVILHTPGHSRDSISVVLSNGDAFVGDVAMNFLRFTGIRHRPIYIEDIQEVYQSWHSLIEHGAKVIYPSHGRPFNARKLVR